MFSARLWSGWTMAKIEDDMTGVCSIQKDFLLLQLVRTPYRAIFVGLWATGACRRNTEALRGVLNDCFELQVCYQTFS